MEIYAVQVFQNDVWRTVNLSTYLPDSVFTYETTKELYDAPVRAARFTVPSFDFVATHCTDFAVLALRIEQLG